MSNTVESVESDFEFIYLNDYLYEILSYVDLKDAVSCSLVNKKFYKIIKESIDQIYVKKITGTKNISFRRGHRTELTPDGKDFFISGGFAGGSHKNDVMMFCTRKQEWKTIKDHNKDSKDSGRSFHCFTYIGNMKYLYGLGYTNWFEDENPKSLFYYNFNDKKKQFTVEKTLFNGDPISGRESFSSHFISSKNIVVFFGGNSEKLGAETKNILVILDLNTNSWVYPKTDWEFKPRHGHASSLMKNENIIICGGKNDKNEYYDDICILDTENWSMKTLDFTMSVRNAHQIRSCIFNEKLIIYGGLYENYSQSGDMSILDLKTFKFIPKSKMIHQDSIEKVYGHDMICLPKIGCFIHAGCGPSGSSNAKHFITDYLLLLVFWNDLNSIDE
eukprot:gene2788-4196_t